MLILKETLQLCNTEKKLVSFFNKMFVPCLYRVKNRAASAYTVTSDVTTSFACIAEGRKGKVSMYGDEYLHG